MSSTHVATGGPLNVALAKGCHLAAPPPASSTRLSRFSMVPWHGRLSMVVALPLPAGHIEELLVLTMDWVAEENDRLK